MFCTQKRQCPIHSKIATTPDITIDTGDCIIKTSNVDYEKVTIESCDNWEGVKIQAVREENNNEHFQNVAANRFTVGSLVGNLQDIAKLIVELKQFKNLQENDKNKSHESEDEIVLEVRPNDITFELKKGVLDGNEAAYDDVHENERGVNTKNVQYMEQKQENTTNEESDGQIGQSDDDEITLRVKYRENCPKNPSAFEKAAFNVVNQIQSEMQEANSEDVEGYMCFFPQGSTKKILSLVKNLPDRGKIETTLRNLTGKADPRVVVKKPRFNKHPRRIRKTKLDTDSWDSLHDAKIKVLKKPQVLTDSSDEFCDVTIRKGDLEMLEDDSVDISDTILKNVQDRMHESKYTVDQMYNKSEKDIKNNVKWMEKVNKKTDAKKHASEKVVPDEKKKKTTKKDVADEPDEQNEKKEDEVVRKEIKFYLDRKLIGLIQKSAHCLGDIKNMMEYGIDAADGEEDFERRRKRASEFSSRFARIHLYDLNRHLKDLEQSLSSKCARPNPLAANQKYFTAHHTLFQALQAYYKHLPTSVMIGVPDKLKELLKHTTSLCEMFQAHAEEEASGDSHDVIQEFDTQCKEMLESLDSKTYISNTKLDMAQSNSHLSLMGGYKSSERRPKRKKPAKPSKLGMYNSVPLRKDVYWKKAVAVLAEKKFNVPSRYKTATYKHRPAIGTITQVASPLAQDKARGNRPKSSSGVKLVQKTRSKCRSAKPSVNDIDNVTTMVQAQDEKEKMVSRVSLADGNVMWNMAQGFFKKIAKENQTMSQGEYECILEHFMSVVQNEEPKNEKCHPSGEHIEDTAKVLLEEKLGKPIEKMEFKEFVEKLVKCANTISAEKKEEDDEDANELHVPEVNFQVPSEANFSYKSSSNSNKSGGRKRIHISGSKNAQLICIKDDSSLRDPSEDEKFEEGAPKPTNKQNSRSTSNISARSQSHSQHELIYKEVAETELKRSKSVLNRVKKQNMRQLDMLPKDMVVKIIQYKLDFHKETKNNYMYKKLENNMSPFVLLEKISEKLMEEAMQSVARDIQVHGVLQKIYSSEFK